MPLHSPGDAIYVSVVIPVYNEEQSLPLLFDRLMPALDALGVVFEVIFVNDGSKDRSQLVLEELYDRRSEHVRILQLARNAGQHRAIIAGFEHVRGQVVVTLDSDLQNPPEDIGKLLALIEHGHDIVGGIRAKRQDRSWRRAVSSLSNALRERITHIRMTDHGSMLRAYRREITDQIVAAGGATPYIPALAHYLASNPAEVPVGHEERVAGQSNYNLYRLIRLNFDLITSFSVVPLQVFTLMGIALSALSFVLVAWLGLRHLVLNPAGDGTIILFAILFLLISLAMTGLGLVGEYIGRIYLEIRHSPHVAIRRKIGFDEDKEIKLLKVI